MTERLALSVRQPWAWAIVAGYKDIENRTWSTPYRGPLLIQATQRIDHGGVRQLERLKIDIPDELAFGAIIGSVDLVDVFNDPSGYVARSNPWAMRGYWHWVLRRPREYVRPIPQRGQQGGLFVVDRGSR